MVSNKVHPATPVQKKRFAPYLGEGEEIIAVFGIGERYFWFTVVPLFILSIPLVGLPFLLKLLRQKHGLSYVLTDRRVLIKDGVFSIKTTTAPYDKITHITVEQDFIKKLSYGIGDIRIHTAGPTPVEIKLIKVQNPLKVKNLIEELILKERSLPLVHPLN